MAQTPQQNFDAMRQDAIRRSKEMQRKAVPMPSPSSPPKPETLQNFQFSEELQHLLTKWDGEKLALLGLLYLLYKEGAEMELLLALAYILL